MVKIEIEYQGDLHAEAVHGPSRTRLTTDAPVDNGGKGAAFSPTDLAATALGTCMVTIMGLFAERHAIDLRGTKVTVLKEMVQQPVRRIGKLQVDIHLPLAPDHPCRAGLETAALTCPVHQSLHPEVLIPVAFHYRTETTSPAAPSREPASTR